MSGKNWTKREGGASQLAYDVLEGSLGVTKRQSHAWGKRALRYFKLAGWMLLTAIVIPIAMISLGLLFGPRGYEGIVAAPLAVLCTWALILLLGLRQKATPQKIARARVADLPAQLADYLESSRRSLPLSAQVPLDGILQHLEEIEPALVAINENAEPVVRLRRLLAEDLTDLIDHYRRLPDRLREKNLHGGPSPKERLASGLGTIREELGRVHEELAEGDLYSLATKERYLEMKYGAESKGS